MSFVYDDGSTTPGYLGSITTGGIRLNSAIPDATHLAGGTFKLEGGNPFLMSPPTAITAIPLGADSGGIPTPTWLTSWSFSLTGWLWVPSGPDDVPGAEDLLRQVFHPSNGVLTLIGNARNWANKWQMYAQTIGQITFDLRHGTARSATRNWTIPMLASDPLIYNADTTQSVDVPMTNTPTTLTNNGQAPAPFTARFIGPFNTASSLIRVSDGAEITLTTTLSAGQYVDVATNNAGTAVVSAIKNDGTNMWSNGAVTNFGLTRVAPGANSWRAAGSSGTTSASKVTVSWRDTR